jgi:PAS domain S-box-containing protein
LNLQVFTDMSIKGKKRAIIKSSEPYQNLIEGAPDSIVAVDLKGNITYCNKATEILTGYTKEELVGKHFSRLGSMESKEIHHSLKLFKALRSGKKVAPFEMQVRHKSGKPYWIEVHLSRTKAGGRVTGFQINTIDITKRKQAEKALIRNERVARERARFLTDLRSLDQVDEILTKVCKAVRDSGLFERAVMTLHKPGGRIAHLGQVGLPPNLVKQARQAPPIDDKLRSRITRKKFRISDSFFIPAEAGLDYTKTKRYIPQKKINLGKGDWQPGDELFVPLWSSSKEIMGYLSLDTPSDGCRPDLKTIQALEMLVEAAAARVRELEAQESLSESEEKFRTLAEQSPNRIFIYKRGKVIYANEKCEEIMGYKREEFYPPDFDFLTLIAPEDRELVKASLSRHIMGKEVEPYEYAIITKEGKKIEAILNTKLINYQGENAILGIITDITERRRTEEEIRKFKTISDRARYGSAIANLEGNLIYINESFAQMHGYKAEELIGKNLSVFHSKEQMKAVERLNKRLIQKGSYIAGEVWHKRKDGTVFPTLMSLTTVEGEKGKPLFIAATGIDITDRKRAEGALKESENRYRNLIESALDIIYTFSPDGTITSLNPSFETITGWKIKDWIGKSFTDLIHPEELSPVMKLIQESIAGKQHPRNEFRLLKKTGDYVPLDFNANPLLKDGKLIGFVGIGRDITERKRAEESLRESEERYRTLVENAADFIYMIDKKNEVLSVNKSAAMLLGKEPNEIIGKSILDLFPTETALGFSRSLKEVFRTGTNRLSETTMIAGGEERWISANLSPVRNHEGKVVAVLGITRDITEKKKMEAQLIQSERLAAVGTLAYGIAHEFNNILAGILGNAEFGMGTDDPEETAECFRIIMESCDRAKSITNSLLAFSRQREEKKQRADVTSAVETILGLVERELEKHYIKVVRKFNPIPGIVCDLGELSGVVLNMITNARDAMRPKGGTLTIEIGKKRDNIEMVFTDTGCGIPDSIKGRIFEPFVTTKGALGQSEIPGTGLGLFLSYGIINRYQGEIEAKSEIDKGSKFTIKIPISKNQTEPTPVETEKEKLTTLPQNLHILLVDDEKPICTAVKKFFEAKGHAVTTALSGKKGLTVFKKGSFDLVLTDIVMPDMDGVELISKLKKVDDRVKFIVLTGQIADEKLEKAKKAGADQILIKPFRNEELYQAIGRVLSI